MSGIFDVFLNPLVLLLISLPLILLFGIWLGSWISQPRKNRVILFEPESGRASELEVDSEDTVNAYCKPIGNTPPQRFIKRNQAFNVVRKGFFKLTNYALWLGRHGTAYTYKFPTSTKKGENADPIKITLKEAFLNILGKDLYERIPNDDKTGRIKDKIEQNEIGMTVEFPDAPLTPNGMPSISSDDVARNNKDIFIGLFARGIANQFKKMAGGEILKIVFILGSGVAIGIVLSLIFHWGAPTIVHESAQTAAMVM